MSCMKQSSMSGEFSPLFTPRTHRVASLTQLQIFDRSFSIERPGVSLSHARSPFSFWISSVSVLRMLHIIEFTPPELSRTR
jgi:hypothetical protein